MDSSSIKTGYARNYTGLSWGTYIESIPKTGTTTEVAEKYDNADKLTQRVTSELTGERLMKKTTETFDSNEKLIRKEVTTYTYDANGNRTSETIVYDGNGNIISGG